MLAAKLPWQRTRHRSFNESSEDILFDIRKDVEQILHDLEPPSNVRLTITIGDAMTPTSSFTIPAPGSATFELRYLNPDGSMGVAPAGAVTPSLSNSSVGGFSSASIAPSVDPTNVGGYTLTVADAVPAVAGTDMYVVTDGISSPSINIIVTVAVLTITGGTLVAPATPVASASAVKVATALSAKPFTTIR